MLGSSLIVLSGFRVSGSEVGFKVQEGLRFRVQGFRFRVSGPGFKVHGLSLRIRVSRFYCSLGMLANVGVSDTYIPNLHV